MAEKKLDSMKASMQSADVPMKPSSPVMNNDEPFEDEPNFHWRLDSNEEALFNNVKASKESLPHESNIDPIEEKRLKKLVIKNPESLDHLYNLATYYFKNREWVHALSPLGKIREMDSSYKKFEILEMIGDCHFESKDYELERVIDAYKTILEELSNPKDTAFVHIYIKMGRAYEKMKLFDRAIKIYSQALQIHPKYDEGHLRLGWAFIRAENITEGIYHLRKGEKLNPESIELKIYLA